MNEGGSLSDEKRLCVDIYMYCIRHTIHIYMYKPWRMYHTQQKYIYILLFHYIPTYAYIYVYIYKYKYFTRHIYMYIYIYNIFLYL